MKKSLVLAMAMALGVTASAYAANPFSDVPAGHWAYDSISKLAAAGVIEGYGDDTFRGDRLMTRYEMAQIVAKAMAKGANVDKLAAEFADELDALGVRVAALEKKADNVKITGNIRYRWRLATPQQGVGWRRSTHDLRTRLTFTGKINDGWQYVGRMENIQNFRDNGNNGNVDWHMAFIQGRLGGVKVKAGRYHEELVGGDSDVYSDRIDGIRLEYGGKLKVMGWYGKLTGATVSGAAAFQPRSRGFGAHLMYDFKNFGAFAGYDQTSNRGAVTNSRKAKLFDVGLKATFKDFGLTAIYLHGDVDQKNANDKKNGFTFEIKYKGAKAAKPGSWGIHAKYYDQGNLTYWGHGSMNDWADGVTGNGGMGALPATNSGFKGFRVGGDWAVAKNMVATVDYYHIKGKDNAGRKAKTVYTQLIMTF